MRNEKKEKFTVLNPLIYFHLLINLFTGTIYKIMYIPQATERSDEASLIPRILRRTALIVTSVINYFSKS